MIHHSAELHLYPPPFGTRPSPPPLQEGRRAIAMDAHRQDPATLKGDDENSSDCPLANAPSVLEGGSEKNDVAVEAPLCAFSGCTSKAMPLTTCHQHILFDSRQTLYQPCAYKTSSGQTCGKPTLRAAAPSFCEVHAQMVDWHRSEAIRVGSPIHDAPRLDLVMIVEMVRQIQNKRRKQLSSSDMSDSDE